MQCAAVRICFCVINDPPQKIVSSAFVEINRAAWKGNCPNIAVFPLKIRLPNKKKKLIEIKIELYNLSAYLYFEKALLFDFDSKQKLLIRARLVVCSLW